MDENLTTSTDGTAIAFQTRGRGPGLVIVPGNNRMAHNYDVLAELLSTAFTVHVMERRGRGASGPQGADYRLEKETADLELHPRLRRAHPACSATATVG